MFGLNIHLIQFKLDNIVLHQNDKIRVSVTTMPEENKQAFFVDARKIQDVHHFFTVNITEKTNKIIIVFRKKSFIKNDPIIASTIIHADQFPKSKSDSTNTELKQIYIYEPINNYKSKTFQDRKIVGLMHVQLSLEDAFPEEAYTTKINYNIGKIHNGEGYSKVESIDSKENSCPNNSLIFVN